jgi:hypothetical protein
MVVFGPVALQTPHSTQYSFASSDCMNQWALNPQNGHGSAEPAGAANEPPAVQVAPWYFVSMPQISHLVSLIADLFRSAHRLAGCRPLAGGRL